MSIRRSACSGEPLGGGRVPPALDRSTSRDRARLAPASGRLTRNRTAPPSIDARSSSRATTSAAPDSRANRVRRTATLRVRMGAESMTTSAKAPQRSSTSAHHAARAGSVGRIIQSSSESARCAQSRGARVRLASMHATQPERARVCPTMCRINVALPLPRAPMISVSRPRGSPLPSNPSSSSSTPVGRADAPEPGGAERGTGRRSTRD